MKIKIFTTGGSIDKYYSTQTSLFEVGSPQVETILHEANLTIEFEVEGLLRKDSLEIEAADRRLIYEQVKADTNRLILITHGTDTMVETARSLLDISGKVIVLTGSMQPATFKHTDAAFNIGFAVAALQMLPDGVYIAMNGRVFDPRTASKNVQAERFEELD